MKSQLTQLTALLALTGCSYELADRVSGNLESGVSSTYYIGMAHDKDLHNFNARCVEGNTQTLKQSLSHWNFKQVENWKSEKLNLGFQVRSLIKWRLLMRVPKRSLRITCRTQTSRQPTYYQLNLYLKQVILRELR